MKKFILFIFLQCALIMAFGQSQRLVLLEEFTSSTCGPCASVNPNFHTWQTQNPDKFTSIYYHVNWPSPGNDPMYAANPTDASARVSYYQVTYVPFSNLDGNYYNGSAQGWNMNSVNARWAMPSPFEVQVRHQLSAGQDSVYSTMLVKCTQDVSGDLVAHNVIIEKLIHFNSAPGTNGEKDFYDVMKKMLPTASGTAMPSSMAPGDYVLLEGSWKFGTVYDPTQIAAIGFIQDKSTKEVFQTANSTTDALVMPYNNDLQVVDVENVTSPTCNSIVTPSAVVRNNGNNTVTSMTIKYRVNDGNLNTYTWNGSLATLQKAVIPLPAYSFNILSQNTLTIYTNDPNSIADEYPKNDTLAVAIKAAPVTSNQITLSIKTDNAPEETTWDIKNSLGSPIATGGPYTQANHMYTENVTLPQADCYTFTIYDSGGNGLCCANGSGAYQVASGSTIVRKGGTFTDSESSEFKMPAPQGVNDENPGNAFSVSPNPFDNSTRVTFRLANAGHITLTLYSVVGQTVSARNLGDLAAGQHETVIDGHSLAPGVYILQLNTGSSVISKKVSVVH